jgi:uncharacterized protein YcbX
MREFTVKSLAVTAVKGTHIQEVDEIELGPSGARGDRRFFLLNEKDRLFNGKFSDQLQTVASSYDDCTEVLSLRFPDGTVIEDRVVTGEDVAATVYGERWNGQLVAGPWADALSALVDRELRLVITDSAVDRGKDGAISLMSSASVQRLAAEAGCGHVDGRRFRMLIEVDGPEAHAEDDWIGRAARVGGALVRFEGHIGRCKVTMLDPDTGVRERARGRSCQHRRPGDGRALESSRGEQSTDSTRGGRDQARLTPHE